MEWAVLSAIVIVFTPLVTALIIYVKTWSRFDITVKNLASVVKDLASVVDKLRENHNELSVRVARVETEVSNLSEQLNLYMKSK